MGRDESLNINIQSETLNVSTDLVEKYNVPGPRYTSYPTAPEWIDSFGPANFKETLAESNNARPPRPLSLYMHLPFCESLCLFCGCNVVISKKHGVSHPFLRRPDGETGRLLRASTARARGVRF